MPSSRLLLAGAASAAACVVLVLAAAWAFELPLGRAAALAPILVVSAGAVAFLVLLWAKVLLETLRAQRHPGRIVAGALAAFALLVVLSFLVELPSGH